MRSNSAMRFFAFLVLFSISQQSQAELTCDELSDVANMTEFYSDDIFLSGRIRDGSRYDDELNELVSALQEIAKIEGDRRFSRWVNQLEENWVDQDWGEFDRNLQRITNRLDDLYDQDC